MLERAIPKHLQTERALPARTPADYQPPFPAYIARFPENAENMVLAVIGIQYPDKGLADGKAQAKINSFLSPNNPPFGEWAEVTDGKGFYNLTLLAYWPSKATYDEWALGSGFRQWWESTDPHDSGHGWFLEVFYPSMDRFESVFSDNHVPEGAAHLRESVSGAIQEHVYWGSMRDRLPVAQTDTLKGEVAASCGVDTSGRVRVLGKRNLAVIRSGQDWSDTLPEERRLYLETMHPVLIEGMNFLRDNGDEVGCHSCRFMDVVDTSTREANKDRTFGLAFFDDLASLEGWSKSHPTHLAIFGGFLQYAAKLQNQVSLRLFHEVLVLAPEQQFFEYIDCHVGTGILGR